jgi:hypothetical protein
VAQPAGRGLSAVPAAHDEDPDPLVRHLDPSPAKARGGGCCRPGCHSRWALWPALRGARPRGGGGAAATTATVVSFHIIYDYHI